MFQTTLQYDIELINDFDAIKDYARGKSFIHDSVWREGIVIRSMIETTDTDMGRLSFKIVDPRQLIKYNKQKEE